VSLVIFFSRETESEAEEEAAEEEGAEVVGRGRGGRKCNSKITEPLN